MQVREPRTELELQLTGDPGKISGMSSTCGPPPEKGEHNLEIYRDWLGYGSDRISELAEQKII